MAELKGFKKWGFRLLAATVIPALLLGLFELGLRLLGYGRPTSFAIKEQIENRWYYTKNLRFTWRFFPRDIAPDGSAFVYPVEKSPGTIRIFVLGGSAAQGDPVPAYGLARMLRVLLRHQYPGTAFEVINTGIAAINSHVVREIAREVARHEPDLMIVYLGNNEVIGPFGAGNPLLPLSHSLALIRARLWAKKTGLGQLLANVAYAVRSDPDSVKAWRGMEEFLEGQVRADDAALRRTYSHFRRNLADICAAARDRHVPLILCTVGVNLRDSAPFASLHRSDLDEADRRRWSRLYNDAVEHQVAQRFKQAVTSFQEAARIDDRFADLHYHLGKCHWAMKSYEQARSSFVLARDLDTLRFRADTEINRIIRTAAESGRDAGVRLVDVARAFAERSPNGVPGEELFDEHVHMNFTGNYVLARALLAQVCALLPERLRRGPARRSPLGEFEAARRLAMTSHDRMLVLSAVVDRIGKPPFTNQLDAPDRDARLRRKLAALAEAARRQPLHEVRSWYERALEQDPNDWVLRDRFAMHLTALGRDPAAAERHLRIAMKLQRSPEIRSNLGYVLLKQGKLDEALEQMRHAVAKRPRKARFRHNLARVLTAKGEHEEAVTEYRMAAALAPDSPSIRYELAEVLLHLGRTEQAIEAYRDVVRLAPNAGAARRTRGSE